MPVLPAVLLLAVATTATKIGTGWYAAGKEGVQLRGRLRAGAALTTRGEFSVIIAGLAVSAGYTAVGPFAAAYVLILAVAGPVLTRFMDSWTDPNRRKRPPLGT